MTSVRDSRGPRPFRQFVLKVHSRCDLACDHCYVYEHADQSWMAQPQVMADRTVDRVAARIAEHAAAHRLPEVHVVLHGGEPLLAGRDRLRRISRALRLALDGVCRLDLRMQTNGILLNEEFCALLVQERIRTGVSLDGDRASHDRHRRRANGSGSHAAAVRAVRLLGSPPYRQAFAGLLCTVDVDNDPVAVYRALAALDPPAVDLLLPHATWNLPPPPGSPAASATPYADWLTTVYDLWTAEERPFRVRLFESAEAADDGVAASTEALGLESPDLAVVETDGEIQQADWLKVVGANVPATGFHVDRDAFDRAATHPGFVARSAGLAGLCATCRSCPVVRTCGGGLYGHRHSSARGFDNPSVYCDDLFRLITHVRERRAAEEAAPCGGDHTLAARDFDELAAGRGGASAVSALGAAERSRRRHLVSAARSRLGTVSDPAWEALVRTDRRSQDAVAEVISHPYVGVWASRAFDAARAADADPGRLAEIALAAAVRAGDRVRLRIRLRSGAVHLPLVGRLVVADLAGPDPHADLEAADGCLFVRLTENSQPVPVDSPPQGMCWEPVPLRRIGGRSVPLDYTDPYLGGFGVPAYRREPGGTLPLPQSALDEAWRIVRSRHPEQAAGVEAFPLSLTPLVARPGADGGIARNAFGAVGLPWPAEPDVLAGGLVEAVQAGKAESLLGLFDLVDDSDGRSYGRPPRPPRDVLRDAYLSTVTRIPGADPGDLAELPLTPLGRRLADILAGAVARARAERSRPCW